MYHKILFILSAVALGYVSNAYSQAACLENAVFWYSQVMMSGKPYFVELQSDEDHIRQALDHVRAPYTVLSSPPGPGTYPRVKIHTSSWVPFVLSEHFYAEADETRRAKFTAYYLGLFGLALSVGDSFDIPSGPASKTLPTFL